MFSVSFEQKPSGKNMEIQQSYLEIFDSDGDRGSKDDDGKDAM